MAEPKIHRYLVEIREWPHLIQQVWQSEDGETSGGKYAPGVVHINPKTGVVIREQWSDDRGVLHRIGGPALIERNSITGEVTRSEYFTKGQQIRPSLGASLQPSEPRRPPKIVRGLDRRAREKRAHGL
jgi:hypothetical protein